MRQRGSGFYVGVLSCILAGLAAGHAPVKGETVPVGKENHGPAPGPADPSITPVVKTAPPAGASNSLPLDKSRAKSPLDGILALGDGSFEDFDDRQAFPTLVDARQVLLQVPGQPYELSQERRNERPIVRMSGVFRLNLPWPPESALRFSLLEPDSLQVHIWCGERGITLRYYKDFQQTWAAYAVVRASGKWQPTEQVLLATSEDRYRRSGLGTVELQRRDGNLVMVRGDLELLTVPMEGPVSEVDFQGKGYLLGVEIGPSKRNPAADTAGTEKVTDPNKTGTGALADLKWEMTPYEGKPPAGITLKKLPEGGVELVAGPGRPSGPGGRLAPQAADAGVHLRGRGGGTRHGCFSG